MTRYHITITPQNSGLPLWWFSLSMITHSIYSKVVKSIEKYSWYLIKSYKFYFGRKTKRIRALGAVLAFIIVHSIIIKEYINTHENVQAKYYIKKRIIVFNWLENQKKLLHIFSKSHLFELHSDSRNKQKLNLFIF